MAAWDPTNTKIASRPGAQEIGRRYADDMVQVTGMAAQSVALRERYLRVILARSSTSSHAEAKAVRSATPRHSGPGARRIVARLQKGGGLPVERILARVEKTTVEDIGLEEPTLVGLRRPCGRRRSPDEAFPPVGGGETVKTKELSAKPGGTTQAAPAAVKADSNGVIGEREPGEEG